MNCGINLNLAAIINNTVYYIQTQNIIIHAIDGEANIFTIYCAKLTKCGG